MSDRISLADVLVGTRARKDFGDLSDLMESIRKLGVLSPITLIPGNHLLCGGRRLEASRQLGLPTIPFHVAETQDDALSRLQAERDENTCRKDMTAEELVDLGMQLEELERPKDEARQRDGQERGRASHHGSGWTSLDVQPEKNKTAKVVGPALGISSASYQRAKTVVQTARGENDRAPDVKAIAQKALADMNAGTTSISGAYNRVQKARSETPEPEPLPRRNSKCRAPKPDYLTILNKSVTSLQGITVALDAITELTVKPEEASRLTADLNQSIRALTRIRKLLQHTECTQ